MLEGENSLDNEIEKILGKEFLDYGINSQSQTNKNGLGGSYREMLQVLMNEQHSPELLQYNELMIESLREKVNIQVNKNDDSNIVFLWIKRLIIQ